jgi:protein-tyrosine-phosphatase
MTILFVCTANINRSFMAERILRGELKKHGKQHIHVSSASLVDMKGGPADPVAAKLLTASGYDNADHQSRLLTEEMVAQADLILVMEDNHRKLILEQYPPAESKVRLLKSYSRDYAEAGGDIGDPHRMSIYRYRLCFSEIYLSIQGLLKCM